MLELVKAPGSIEQQIDSHFGQITRDEFLMAPSLDLLVHSWDRAKGTSQNTNLDTGLVEVCYNGFDSQMDGLRTRDRGDGRKIFGAAVQIVDSAHVQDKLTAMLGRQP